MWSAEGGSKKTLYRLLRSVWAEFRDKNFFSSIFSKLDKIFRQQIWDTKSEVWMVTLVIGDRCRKRGRPPVAKERNAAAKRRRLEEVAIITEVAAGALSGMPQQQTEGRRCWRIGTLSTISWIRLDIPKIRQDAQELFSHSFLYCSFWESVFV